MDKREDIFNEYIERLPLRNAPDEVWDRLQTSMFQVEASQMPMHYPPVSLWHRIDESQKKTMWRRKTMRWSVLALMLLLLGSAAVLNWPEAPSKPADNDSAAKQAASANLDEEENDVRGEEIINIPGKTSFVMIQRLDPPHAGKKSLPSRILSEPVLEPAGHEKLRMMESLNAALLSRGLENLSFRQDPDECSPFYAERSMQFGLSYEYQIFADPPAYINSQMRYWQNLALSTRIKWNRFFLEPGIGLALSRDRINWNFDFLRKEIVDSYVYVDSVHYDPATGETTYYTSIVEVYDSIPHTEHRTTYQNHLYLHIPFRTGILLNDGRKFDFGITAGIVYNLLMRSNEVSVTAFEPESRTTSVNLLKTSRLENNWRLSFGLHAEWKMSQSLNVYFAPCINYYLNSLYQDKQRSGSLSFGLRCGIYLN